MPSPHASWAATICSLVMLVEDPLDVFKPLADFPAFPPFPSLADFPFNNYQNVRHAEISFEHNFL